MGYNDMHLTDLRRFAKKIGVRRPTTYNKDVLIEKIIEIEKGITQPYFNNLGRPVKKREEAFNTYFAEFKKDTALEAQIILHAIKKAKGFLEELETEIEELVKKGQAD